MDTGDNPQVGGKSKTSNEAFLKNLDRVLNEQNCEISLILCTHLHTDHFGGIQSVVDKYGQHIEVGMLPAPPHTLSIFTVENLIKRDLIEELEMMPSGYQNGRYVHQTFTDEELPPWKDEDLSWDIAGRSKSEIQADYSYQRSHYNFYKKWEDSKQTGINGRSLKHGEVIKVEGATLRVVKSPGHAENHISFVIDEEHSIFSGDNVLGYGTTMFAELYDYMGTLESMQRFSPVRLYPGHGPYIADGRGLLDRYRAHREAREYQVYEWLKEVNSSNEFPTSMEIAKSLYTSTPENRIRQAQENVEKILIKLLREGKCNCYTDNSKTIKGELPEYGYIQHLDDNLIWMINDEVSPEYENKFNDYVSEIMDAMFDVYDVDGRKAMQSKSGIGGVIKNNSKL